MAENNGPGETLAMVVPSELANLIRAKAKEKKRTISQFLRIVLEEKFLGDENDKKI